MARGLSRSLLSVALLLLVAVAAAAAASRDESTIESEDSAVVITNEGRALKACPSGQGIFNKKCYCRPGYGWNSRVRKCFYCPPGYYKSGYNFNSCKKCRSDYLVDDPIRSQCQPYCRRTNDFSTTYWKGYVAVAYPTYFYDWDARGSRDWDSYWSAAEVCDRIKNEGYFNYVPARVPDSDRERGYVNDLARFHFKCYPRTNWYYWVYKSSNDDSPNKFGQCDRVRISDGFEEQVSGNKCFPEGGSRWKYPVICSKGCRRWCRSCDSRGRCTDCESGYTKTRSGDCTRDFTPFQEDK